MTTFSMGGKRKEPDWSTVTEFENKIAAFFGAPYAVAVDSCTHGLELCLRYRREKNIISPHHTYLSVPMLAGKLNIELIWCNDGHYKWQGIYTVSLNVIDAATLFRRNSYIPATFMCLSFQHQKHLSLGRGGMILCDNKEAAGTLKHMSYDGRIPGIPWREQDIDTMGYHYYMTPETAALGLQKLPEAMETPPRIWSWQDYPDLTQMKIFKR